MDSGFRRNDGMYAVSISTHPTPNHIHHPSHHIPSSQTMHSSYRPAHPSFRRRPESRTNHYNKSTYKSRHWGFIASITLIFQARFQLLIAFSRLIADAIVSWTSYQTRVATPYLLVKPSTKWFLCSQTRFTRLEVTPRYKVPFRWLANR